MRYSYINCTLNTTSKFNFNLLPNFIKNFKEYLKYLERVRIIFSFSFSQQCREVKLIVILWANTRHAYHCNRSSFGFIFGSIFTEIVFLLVSIKSTCSKLQVHALWWRILKCHQGSIKIILLKCYNFFNNKSRGCFCSLLLTITRFTILRSEGHDANHVDIFWFFTITPIMNWNIGCAAIIFFMRWKF